MLSLAASLPVPDLAEESSKDPGLRFVSLARPVAGFQSAKGDLNDGLESVGSLLLLLGMPPGITPSDVCSGRTPGCRPLLLEAPAGWVTSVDLKRCLKLWKREPEAERMDPDELGFGVVHWHNGMVAANRGGPGPIPE